MSSEFTFGDNSDELSIFQKKIKKKLVDRDLTEYQITQTLTLSRLHAQLEQTRGIRLFKHPLEQTSYLSFSLQVNALRIRFVRIRGVTSWNESMAGTAWLRSAHRRCFSCWNLVCMVCVGKPGQPEQIVDIPVPQIVEEIAEVNKSLIVCNSILNLYFEEIKVFFSA